MSSHWPGNVSSNGLGIVRHTVGALHISIRKYIISMSIINEICIYIIIIYIYII